MKTFRDGLRMKADYFHLRRHPSTMRLSCPGQPSAALRRLYQCGFLGGENATEEMPGRGAWVLQSPASKAKGKFQIR